MRLFWICAAGAAGTGLRHLVNVWAVDRWGGAFPYGTMLVNLTGCFVMSAVMETALRADWPATVRLAVITGLLGGFTTYSAFNEETLRLVERGSHWAAMANVGLTVGGGVLSGAFGMALARAAMGR